MPSLFFDKIIHPENIKKAYFDILLKFDTESKSNRYRGIDGIKTNTLDFTSEEVLQTIRNEMINFTKISPAYMTAIPKKNGSKRKIYVYSVKERIKAEALYRVLLPFFDSYFSPYLFSYRSSHPSYYAARSAVRRYKRYYGQNYVLVTDISDYADTIDHQILMSKLQALGLDEATLKHLELFIKTDTLEEGVLIQRPRGVLTGTPLYALLSNLYMDEFDKWAGKYIAFYRRVGDDIIAMDKDEQKILNVQEKLSETVSRLKLKLNQDKARLIQDTEEFKFLGYSFKNKKIGFDQSSRNKTITHWGKILSPLNTTSQSRKIRQVRSLMNKQDDNLQNQFVQLIDQKNLVDNTDQIQELSEVFFKTLTSFFTGSYSSKNRRKVSSILKQIHTPSLFKEYIKIRYPRKYASKK